jgi:hypothetical protein
MNQSQFLDLSLLKSLKIIQDIRELRYDTIMDLEELLDGFQIHAILKKYNR